MLGGLPAGFDASAATILNVYFQYGTDMCEPRFPGDGGEPPPPPPPPPGPIPEPLTLLTRPWPWAGWACTSADAGLMQP